MPDTIAPLGSERIPLRPPKSLASCYDIVLSAQTNPQRAFAASLGMCWVGPGKPRAKYERSFSPLQYGGEVLDELLSRGISIGDIQTAGILAFGLVSKAIVPAEAVSETEGFSVAPGNSTSK